MLDLLPRRHPKRRLMTNLGPNWVHIYSTPGPPPTQISNATFEVEVCEKKWRVVARFSTHREAVAFGQGYMLGRP